MKKLLAGILAAITLISLQIPAFSAETKTAEAEPAYTIVVGGQALDLGDLPCAPYWEGDTLMVPLRKIAEALGYQVDWDPETGAVTVEDAYVQKAVLFDGTEQVVFEGKLQIINMDREVSAAAKTVIHSGYTYVPLEFFQEFINDTAVDGTVITVAPSMCELTGQKAAG